MIGNNLRSNGIQIATADDCFGPLHSLGYNLIETTSNCSINGTSVGNVTGQDPVLGPLQNNGGPTQTHAPLTGSPAIDNGDNLACPATDQRGKPRPVGLACDVGAVERQAFDYVLLYLPLIRK